MRLAHASSIVLLAFAIACSGDDDKDDDNGDEGDADVCTPNEVVDCGDVPSEDVDGATYVAGLGQATCSGSGSGWDVTQCTELVAGEVGSLCDPSQNGCEEGLACLTNFAESDTEISACWQQCESDSSCSNGEVCQQTYPTYDYVCSSPDAARDEFCGFGTACEDSANTCVLSVNLAQECKQLCPRADIGTTSSCASSETCLDSGTLVIPVGSDGLAIGCDDDTDCDASNEFVCSEGDGVCVRFAAACGTAMPTFTDLSEDNINAEVDTSTVCGSPGVSQYCAPLTNGGTVETECTPAGFVLDVELDADGNEIVCTTAADCSFLQGYDCLELTTGNRCTFEVNICIAFCEDTNGTPSGECGAGLSCTVPENYWGTVAQMNGDDVVTCENNDDCDGENGFECVEYGDGNFCVRPRKACTDAI